MCETGPETDRSYKRALTGKKQMSICQLGRNGSNGGWKKLTACVDSGAVRSVAPKRLAPGIPISETEESKTGVTFHAASGSAIEIYGEKTIPAVTESGYNTQLKYTIADVSRPLMAVVDICDRGKRVAFDNAGSYIEDKKTGHREAINRVGNAYDFVTWVREEHGAAVNKVGENDDNDKTKAPGFTRLDEAM